MLAALEDVRGHFGGVEPSAVVVVAEYFGVPASRVQSLLEACGDALQPATAGGLQICTGPVCRNAGAESLLEHAGELAVASHCLGACDHAPVARLDGRLIAEAAPDDLGL